MSMELGREPEYSPPTNPNEALREGLAACNGDMNEYLYTLLSHHSRSAIGITMYNVAILIGHAGAVELPYPDSMTDVSWAFSRGSVLGLEVARQLLGREYSPILTEEASYVSDRYRRYLLAERPRQELREHVGELMDMADLGLVQMRYLANFLYEHIDEVESDVSLQPYVQRGFGLIMCYLAQFLEKQAVEDRKIRLLTRREDLEAFAAELERLDDDALEELVVAFQKRDPESGVSG